MPHQGSEILQHMKHYRNPDLTKRDIMQAVVLYKGLSLKWDFFVFNNGEKKELLCLDGTIPVNYKGTTYNIPSCIWIMETHPYNAPLCFVRPTSEMQIKVSHHVDQTGKIYLPYLHEWKPNSSDLVGLIQVMIVVFGDHPPVYSKGRSSHSGDHTHPTYPSHGVPGYVPLPNIGTQATPQYQFQSYPQPTGMPTYPPTSTNMPMPMPALPPQQPTGGYKYPGITTTNYQANTGGIRYPPSSMPYPSYSGTTNVPVYPSSSPYANYPQPTSALPQTSAPVTTNTISEEHIKASVLSAVEDKMKRRLRDVFSQAQAEMDVLKRTGDELGQGKTKLESIINKLEAEQMELDKNVFMLQEKNEAMANVISKLENQESIDVDEAVVTTTPLYKQLLNLFAEENATEDAIYYLGEALRKGIIDLDLFLKHVRDLSRKQYMLRALMQKCREKASLPCY
uniref:UEV domain-containing protein n=1 Tax=Strigamia maritima TaxID=126957 RepID=T1JPK6_STRMM